MNILHIDFILLNLELLERKIHKLIPWKCMHVKVDLQLFKIFEEILNIVTIRMKNKQILIKNLQSFYWKSII